jgi:hypothetical protein
MKLDPKTPVTNAMMAVITKFFVKTGEDIEQRLETWKNRNRATLDANPIAGPESTAYHGGTFSAVSSDRGLDRSVMSIVEGSIPKRDLEERMINTTKDE